MLQEQRIILIKLLKLPQMTGKTQFLILNLNFDHILVKRP